MNVNVTCKIKVYDETAKPDIYVHSHWNHNDRVVLEVNGVQVTVVANDLIAAIENCVNTNRF